MTMGNVKKNIENQHSFVLGGSVKTYDCNPSERCGRCGGNGRCPNCNGLGSYKCTDCGGSGTCRKCQGSGQERCHYCGGSGVERDYNGRVTRSCGMCSGKGFSSCSGCFGFGECRSCGGSGEHTCMSCDGDGNCSDCSGSGEITCSRCNGSGKYQTFQKSQTTLYRKSWTFGGSSPLSNLVENTSGTVIYNDTVAQWSGALKQEFNKESQSHEIIKSSLGDASVSLLEEYNKSLSENSSLKNPDAQGDIPYDVKVKAESVPVVKVNYKVNGKAYSIHFVGNDTIVAYNDVPKVLETFKVTFFEKLKLSLSETKRLKAFSKMAAYIFNRNGLDSNESKLLNLMVSKLNMSDSKKKNFYESLRGYNESMPYDVFKKQVKSLFISKKTLTFAWHCMSIDKDLSKDDEDLFNKLCEEYASITPEERENLKNMALRFSKMPEGSAIDMYADLSCESKKIRGWFWFGLSATAIVLLIVLCFFLNVL